MRKRFAAAVATAVGSVSLMAGTAAASTFYEPVNYTSPGALVGQTNASAPSTINGFTATNVWTQGSVGSNPPSVVSGDLTYPGLPTDNTGSVIDLGSTASNALARIGIGQYTVPAGSATSQTIYFSMLVKLPTGSLIPSTSGVFAGVTGKGSFLTSLQFNPSTAGSGVDMSGSGSGGAAPILVHEMVDGSGNPIGVSYGIGYRDINTGNVQDGTDPYGNPAFGARVFDNNDVITPGSTTFLVGKLTINDGDFNDVAQLFVNPDPTAAEPGTPSAQSDYTDLAGATAHDYFYNNSSGLQLDDSIRSLVLRSTTLQPANMQVDEIRIGSSWLSVTTVPEPASLSLLGLSGIGLLKRRRRRRA